MKKKNFTKVEDLTFSIEAVLTVVVQRLDLHRLTDVFTMHGDRLMENGIVIIAILESKQPQNNKRERTLTDSNTKVRIFDPDPQERNDPGSVLGVQIISLMVHANKLSFTMKIINIMTLILLKMLLNYVQVVIERKR